MAGWFHDERVFWRQFRQQFHTTGAVLPSGRFLARSLARYVGGNGAGQRILEVGPGTGAVTAQIVRVLGPHDRLDLVELNDDFVRRLNERFATERAVSSRRPAVTGVARQAARAAGRGALRPGDLRAAAEQLQRGRRGGVARRR